MRDGWIKVWRKIEDNPVLFDSIRYALFVRLLNRAACYPCKVWFKGLWFDLNRGDALMSEREMAELLGCDRQRIRTALKVLEGAGMINRHGNPRLTQEPTQWLTHKLTQNTTRLSICNYDQYQSGSETANPMANPMTNPRALKNQPTEKEEEESKKDSTPHASHVPPKGGNGENSDHRGSRLKKDWEPGDDGVEYARKLGMSDDTINESYHDFMRYWLAKAGAAARKVDWDLTWQTWVRKANERVREKAAREEAWRQRFQQPRH